MSFSRLLGKHSHANLVPPAAGSGPSADDPNGQPQRQQSSEVTRTIPRPWRRKRPSSAGDSSTSRQMPTSPLTSKAAPQGGVREMPIPMPVPSIVMTNLVTGLPEMIPDISPVRGKLAEAWDAVKDDPGIAKTNRELDTVDDATGAIQNDAQPFIPVITATVAAAAQSGIGKAIKDGIDTFSEGMPVLMKALDELKTVHPFIGVVVLAFKTVYTLEQKRRDNDKKIISLYVGMKDMMGALLVLKDVENDKLVTPDGTNIEDRLKSLVQRTADDIKTCSNVCDAYAKKRLLAKVLLSSLWDMKLLDFVGLFATRRKEFEFELTMHSSQGIDKANVKLDAVGNATKEIKEQMDVMKALFEQLVSPEQKLLTDLVNAKGGLKVLRNNDKTLLDLEKAASKGPNLSNVEGYRTRQSKRGDVDLEVGNLREDILEDPNTAAEKNWVLFSRKFEAQKNQIIDELTFVVQRESDRVVKELKGKAHERIRDRSIHELWLEMAWRGNVKARHLVLALRDYYLEKLTSEIGGISDMGSAISDSTDPDAWAIKYIDAMWVQPILEAMDDDASGFITISEVNRFTSSRPVDWSLPHWMAFWAVGFKWSIIDYSRKIEDMFAKMEGLRSVVLPPNQAAVDRYFACVYITVHSLTAAVLSQDYSQNSGSDDSKRFSSYLEAEEARLENNLQAVDYVIDGTDTLPLITGVGRIEKTVFPLLYVLLKRHYEIMRIMRTKILSMRELMDGWQGILYIVEAITCRVQDLTYNFSQQRLDPEKQFQSFAFGIFRYMYDEDSLWSVDYAHSLDSQIIPYNDDHEDQNVQPEDILNHECKDDLSLDYSVYDGHSTEYIPKYGDVDPPMKEILGKWNGYYYDLEGANWGVDSMMTFVLAPGEGEHELKTDVWSLQGHQAITGSWSKGEDDVVQIKFRYKILLESNMWTPIYFDVHFDRERDALTGVWGPSSSLESTTWGKIEFRRILPRYFAVYPPIKELSDDKPRALWKFAIAAVRNDIRRDHWTWSYFSQRRDERKTISSLLLRSRWFGPPLDEMEAWTLYTTTLGLTPGDACFYGSMVDHIRAYTCVHENTKCDSCDGTIGGPRLFCLDCAIKNKTLFNTVDFCGAAECVGARISERKDLEEPHEPNHRLVKVRTTVLLRSAGRVHTAACGAFERVEDACKRVAESTSDPDEETGADEQKSSSSEPSLAETGVDEQKTSSLEPSSAETGLDEQKTSSLEPSLTETPAKSDKPDDVPNPPDDTEGGAEPEGGGEAAQDGSPDQVEDGDLPECGKCSSRLSFPFWYCIFCEDNLYICDACDADGVPELTRSSGKHTEEHHLIRCLAPDDEDEAPTDHRLTLIEGRLDGLQTQLNDLTGRMGDLTGRVGDLTGRTEDLTGRIGDLTGHIGDLNARIGSIEQLLQRLIEASEGRTA